MTRRIASHWRLVHWGWCCVVIAVLLGVAIAGCSAVLRPGSPPVSTRLNTGG
jgi:hypothetical protein